MLFTNYRSWEKLLNFSDRKLIYSQDSLYIVGSSTETKLLKIMDRWTQLSQQIEGRVWQDRYKTIGGEQKCINSCYSNDVECHQFIHVM